MMRVGLPTTATRSSEAYWAPRGYCQVKVRAIYWADEPIHPALPSRSASTSGGKLARDHASPPHAMARIRLAAAGDLIRNAVH